MISKSSPGTTREKASVSARVNKSKILGVKNEPSVPVNLVESNNNNNKKKEPTKTSSSSLPNINGLEYSPVIIFDKW